MTKKQPKILIIYYSFSGQTGTLMRSFASGLEKAGCRITMERLQPLEPLRFPLGSIPATITMMLTTFFRKHLAIAKLNLEKTGDYDLIILSGPTWSYNPSGPVLSLLERDGRQLFANRKVIPFISCRGYWRAHWHYLRKRLQRCGAEVPNLVVFTHPNPEPWRTIGVFFKIAGKHPEKTFLKKYYHRFGHSRVQHQEATRFGRLLGNCLKQQGNLSDLDFKTKTALQ